MKTGSVVKCVVLAAALLVSGMGCGGIAASQTVSPLMFLLPGLGQTKPAQLKPSVPGQTATDQLVAQAY